MPRLAIYSYSGLVVFGAIVFTLFGSRLGLITVGFWVMVLVLAMQSFRKEFETAWRFSCGIVKRKASGNSY